MVIDSFTREGWSTVLRLKVVVETYSTPCDVALGSYQTESGSRGCHERRLNPRELPCFDLFQLTSAWARHRLVVQSHRSLYDRHERHYRFCSSNGLNSHTNYKDQVTSIVMRSHDMHQSYEQSYIILMLYNWTGIFRTLKWNLF